MMWDLVYDGLADCVEVAPSSVLRQLVVKKDANRISKHIVVSYKLTGERFFSETLYSTFSTDYYISG